MRALVAVVVLLLAVPAAGLCQEPVDPAALLADGIRAATQRIRDARPNQPGATLSLAEDLQTLALALGGVDETSVWALMEEGRTDKQVGSAAPSSGATSLVAKGGVPAVIGLALEHGALTREESGTTLTLRGTPTGIFKALARSGYLDTYIPASDPTLHLLQRLSFVASFDTSRGGAPGQFTADLNQLSAVGGRFTFIDHRDPRHARWDAEWQRLVPTQIQLTVIEDDLDKALNGDLTFTAWLDQTGLAIAAASDAELGDVVRSRVGLLRSLPVGADARGRVRGFVGLFTPLLAQRAAILKGIERGVQVAFDYTNERPASRVNTSNLRLIGSIGGAIELTANAAVTLFDGTLPAGIDDRVRDLQVSLQLDVPMGRPEGVGRYLLSFAYRVQRLQSDVLMAPGMVAPDTSGTVSVGQIKLMIPIKNSPAKIPFSVTFANRTELIKEKVVRGNIGLTYDLDGVLARFKP
jgi:hypothetical protein